MFRDESFTTFEVRPFTGALGAEVLGVDLQTASEDVFEDVRRALYQYHVLAVRDQDLTPATLQKVARRFGPFSGNPVHTPLEGFEDIVKFVREPDDTGKVIGEEWHMDLAWLPKPPGITMLFGEEVPPVGGDTCFSSLEKAYTSLSPKLVSTLEDLTGVHSGRGVYAINASQKRLGVTKDVEAIENAAVEHPVICQHPVTGRRYVLVSSVMTHFKGMTEEESKPLVDYLNRHSTQPEFVYRHQWRPNDIVLWDNRCTMHQALGDFDQAQSRYMERSTVIGTPLGYVVS